MDKPLNEINRSPDVNAMLDIVRAAGGLRKFAGIHDVSCSAEYSDKNIYTDGGWGALLRWGRNE